MSPSSGKRSAGLLMFRRRPRGIEVFLVHPGGPFFARKDAGWWTIPKGEIGADEEPLDVAKREFAEETGQHVESCGGGRSFLPLGSIVQRGGKTVHAWAFEGDWPADAKLSSNTFALEWPKHSGRLEEFPEVDKGEFFTLEEARLRINPAQADLLDRLLAYLAPSP